MNNIQRTLAKIGAIAYVLWGVLHIIVGAIPVINLLTSGPAAQLRFYNFNVEALTFDDTMIHASYLMAEHSFELVAFGIMAIIIAVALNWHNEPLGFWLNFVVLGMVDLAFVLGEIVPGYVPVGEGIIGPVLFVIGAIFTGAALLVSEPAGAQQPAAQAG